MPVVAKRRRPPVGRPMAAENPHVARADAAVPAMAAAWVELLGRLGGMLDGRLVTQLANVAAPEVVAGWVSPELPVAKKATTDDIERLMFEVANGSYEAELSIGTSFQQENPLAVAWARRRSAQLVTEIDAGTRRTIRALVTRGQQGQYTAEQIAREIRPVIGLTAEQATAAWNYRDALLYQAEAARHGPGAADSLRNRYALSPWRGGPLEGDRVSTLYQQYVDRQLRHRAETIARTETINAAGVGELLAQQQRVTNGSADGMMVVREWSVTHDDRACALCLKLDGKKRTSGPVGPDDRPTLRDAGTFGGVDHPPLHPRCRCTVITTYDIAPPETPNVTPPPETWRSSIDDDMAEARAELANGRGTLMANRLPDPLNSDAQALMFPKAGMVPGPRTMRAEAAIRRAGEGIGREIAHRLKGQTPGALDDLSASIQNRLNKLNQDMARRVKAMAHERGPEGGRIFPNMDSAYMKLSREFDRLANEMNDVAGRRKSATSHYAVKLREVLAELRPMGGDLRWRADGWMAAGLKEKVDNVTTRFPRDWIDRSNGSGVKIRNEEGRANYLLGTLNVSYQQGRDPTDSVFAHELMHRMEDVSPDIKLMEWAFWNRRTALPQQGEDPLRALANGRRERSEWMGKGYGPAEMTRPDEFGSRYMGKDYGGKPDSFYELMTTGLEHVWYGRYKADDDYRAFVLGVLATL